MAQEITGEKQTVRVGQKISLQPGFTDETWGSLHQDTVKWTVEGTVVKGYNGEGRTDVRVERLTDEDKQKPFLEFYWIEAGTFTVKATCDFDNEKDVTVSTQFEVKRPTVTFRSQTSAVDVYGGHRHFGTALSYGLAASSAVSPGIRWRAQVKTESPGKGTLKFVQLTNSRVWYVTNSRATFEYAQPKGRFDLDASNPYDAEGPNPGTWPIGDGDNVEMVSEDSPSVALTMRCSIDGERSEVKQYSAHGRFKLWVMYKPDCDEGSIWVPLSKMNWYWRGTAMRDETAECGWRPQNCSNDSPSGTATTRVEDFPEWEFLSRQGKRWVRK